MGWMFLPMKPYHAGGDAASFEPYTAHLQAYEFALSQYLGSGCGMTYRGDKLFDSFGDASHKMVKAKVAWFKAHRDILSADIVHVARPTGVDLDAFVHVSPRTPSHAALALVFNPTAHALSAPLALPLYYTGLDAEALVTVGGGARRRRLLARDYSLEVNVSVGALSTEWVLVERPPAVPPAARPRMVNGGA